MQQKPGATRHDGRVSVYCSPGGRTGNSPPFLQAWSNIEADFEDGHLLQVDILWRAALNRAAELSRVHTPRLGTRALDVLHVGCALELKLRHFLTFDERQQKLAVACGLKPVKL